VIVGSLDICKKRDCGKKSADGERGCLKKSQIKGTDNVPMFSCSKDDGCSEGVTTFIP
jgi:hypothetical protein